MAAEYPFLSLAPTATEPLPSQGSSKRYRHPTPARQAERLADRFDRIESALLGLAVDPAAPNDADPELVIVFEIIDDPAKALRALTKFGVDVIGEEEERHKSSDDFHTLKKVDPEPGSGQEATEKRSGAHIVTTIYAVMTSARQIRDLLTAWNRYTAGEPTPAHFAQLFENLHDIRNWDERDRIRANGQRSGSHNL